MPAPLAIAALVAAARAARAVQLATRVTGGIKTAKTVQKVYKEGSAPPARTQAQINEEGIAKAREALGVSKPDPKAVARKITQDKANEMARIRKQGRNTR
jgi:signal transduction protein with GAF and PtsI domain